MGMVQQLVALVRTEHSPFHEHVLGALCRCAGSLRECGLAWAPPPPRMAPMGSGLPAHRGGRSFLNPLHPLQHSTSRLMSKEMTGWSSRASGEQLPCAESASGHYVLYKCLGWSWGRMRSVVQIGELRPSWRNCLAQVPVGVLCRGRPQGLFSCSHSLVTDFPQGVRECREPELGLEELLRHRCQLLQQHEEYQVGLAEGTRAGVSSGQLCPCPRGLYGQFSMFSLCSIHVFLLSPI